ncbi:MAG: hypothetical protein ILM98_05965 [Kiritimatiellae bacterium]|nr:hypothetical protein [Kiritimatiellia bacterium]
MEAGFPKKCCVCGRSLPNKYAVAGTRVSADGGEEAFCAWHWNPESKRHNAADTSTEEPDPAIIAPMEPVSPIPATVQLTVEQKKSAARAALDAIAKLGAGVASLVKKLSSVQDPQEMIDSFGAALEANRQRREPLQTRYEALFAEIAAKKKLWVAAPPARKKILELELRSLLSEYQGLERQLTAYFENERTLVTVRTRVEEIVALEMRKVSENQIDRLTDKLDDAVDDAEDVNGALSDLEKAGARREGDSASLEEALSGFDLDGLTPENGIAEPQPVAAADVAIPAEPAAPAAAPMPDLADLMP